MNRAVFFPPHAMGRLVLLLVFLFYAPRMALALTVDAETQLRFADGSFKEGRYSEAISEYRRFLFFFPEDRRRIRVIFQIGLSHVNTEAYEPAIACFQEGFQSEEADIAFNSGIMLARCHQRMGSLDQALQVIERLIEKRSIPRRRDLAIYEKGWLYMEAGRVEEGRSAFLEIGPETNGLLKIPELASRIDGFSDIRLKSPALAGTLSLFPGAGYGYCERYQDAFFAFAVNATLIWAAVEAFDHDLYAIGGIVGFTAAGFYGGNVVGAIGSAKKFNRRARASFIDALVQNHKVVFGVNPEKRAGVLSLDVTY